MRFRFDFAGFSLHRKVDFIRALGYLSDCPRKPCRGRQVRPSLGFARALALLRAGANTQLDGYLAEKWMAIVAAQSAIHF